MFKKVAEVNNKKSLSNKLRKKRFLFFLELIKDVSRPMSILDIGGTLNFWEKMEMINDKDFKITLFNIKKEKVVANNIKSLEGEISDLKKIKDNEFDIVFSNSTIEHLFNFDNQEKMANEIGRIGKRYFVQTPNRYFPIEPHFLFPFFQFFPLSLKIWMISHFDLGWRKKQNNLENARKSVEEIKLLSEKDLLKIFPEGRVWKEKFSGFTKSLVIYKGF